MRCTGFFHWLFTFTHSEEEDEEGEEPWRTSTTAWCSDDFCLNDPIVQTIQRKIGLTTGVLDDNYYEHLQLLKYGELTE